MKGDFSRRTFDPADHYSAVLVEQGRMLTDADLEEEHRILAHRIETEALDLIGGCGGPIGGAGFAITAPAPGDFEIGAGRYYVDGILVENDVPPDGAAAFTYLTQPDRHGPTALPALPARYVAYLDVWHRLITALDDPAIREVALGGPTTSVRERIVWQVRVLAVDDDATCADALDALDDPDGRLAARAVPEAATDDVCVVPPSAGYQGLENQLYRVEIHEPGAVYDLAAAPNVFTVTGFPAGTTDQVVVDGGDPWEVGEAVEIFRAGPGFDPLDATLAYVAAADDATLTLTLNTDLPAFAPGDLPMLRRVGATFVWSRDNGSVVTAIERIDGDEITVRDLGPDDVLGFLPGQWVEVVDDRLELEAQPGELARIASIDAAARVITLHSPVQPLANPPDGSGVDAELHPKLRRWDGLGAVRGNNPAPNDDWIELESGVQVRFSDGDHRTGDYWHFPARTATAGAGTGHVEWPGDPVDPDLLPPHGIAHHRCPLALFTLDDAGGISELTDCRSLFPPVTALTNLLYVGGDGQEGTPDPANPASRNVVLGDALRVRVVNGGLPVAGVAVRFEIVAGNGQLQGAGVLAVDLLTDADGIATCEWRLDGATPDQVCEARLLDSAGNPIAHQRVRFHASLSTAARVAYDPSECPNLAGVRTVQEALDRLCRLDGGGGRCCCVTVGEQGEFPRIEEAIRELLGRGELDICLCLLPGTHQVTDLTVAIEDLERGAFLRIGGCGGATRLIVRQPIRLAGWTEVTFTDLAMFCEPGVDIELVRCARVRVERCRILGTTPERVLVAIGAASEVTVADSTLEALRELDIDLPRLVLEGNDAVVEAISMPRPAEFELLIHGAAAGLVARDIGERRAYAREIRQRVSDLAARLSQGEAASYRRFGDAVRDATSDMQAFVEHLRDIRSALTRALPAIVLEIGWLAPGAGVPDDAGGFRDAAAILENNRIAGAVNFYGPADLDWRIPVDLVRRLQNQLEQREVVLSGMNGVVQLRNNRLTRLLAGASIVTVLEALAQAGDGRFDLLLESFHATDNVIDGIGHLIAARHVSLGTNEFTVDAVRGLNGGQPPQRLNLVAGDSLVAVGNHGRVFVSPAIPPTLVQFAVATRVRAESANLEIDFS